MADYRQCHTKIWADSWFIELSSEQKLLFMYLFSNQRASVCGLYELPIRVMSFETGIDRDTIKKCLEVYTKADKAYYDFNASVLWVVNMPKYQSSTSPKLKARIEADITAVPDCELKRLFFEKHPEYTVSIGYGRGSDTSLSVSNSVSVSDSDSDSISGENVFAVYQANIGMLTPMISDAVQDAERTYTGAWVIAAIQEAVDSNARSWKYCEAILQRWKRDGFKSARAGKLPPRESVEEYNRRIIQEIAHGA
jgi:DnaD/phage-associated family protein